MFDPVSTRRAGAFGASLATHLAFAALLLILLTSSRAADTVDYPTMRASLRYVNVAGVGGGGGGSNIRREVPRPGPPVPVEARPVVTPPPAPMALSLVATSAPLDIPGAMSGLSTPVVLAPGNPGGTAGTPGRGAGPGRGEGEGPGRGGNTGGGIYGPGDNVTVPELLYERKATYTTDAVHRRVQGEVEIEAIVMADGSVTKPRIVKSLDPGLDRRALDAVVHWRFKPGRLRDTNQPVNVIVRLVLGFTLR